MFLLILLFAVKKKKRKSISHIKKTNQIIKRRK